MTNNNNRNDRNNEVAEELEKGNGIQKASGVSVLHQPAREMEVQRSHSSRDSTPAETGTPASHGTGAKDRDPPVELGADPKVADKRYIHPFGVYLLYVS